MGHEEESSGHAKALDFSLSLDRDKLIGRADWVHRIRQGVSAFAYSEGYLKKERDRFISGYEVGVGMRFRW